MTELSEEEQKQLEKEYGLSGGKWITHSGIDAYIDAQKIIDQIPEGYVMPLENGYAKKENGRIVIYRVDPVVNENFEIGIIESEEKIEGLKICCEGNKND